MKRLLLCILAISLLFVLPIGCKKQEEIKQSNEILSMYHIASYETLEELTNKIKTAKHKQENNQELSQDDEVLLTIKQLHKPAIEIPEYTMYRIEVSKYNVRYWYYPNSIEYSEITSTKELLSITFQHPKENVDQFDQVVQQHREQKKIEPTNEGVIYDYANRDITFRMGTSYGYVTVPESMNTYETILPLCQYEIVEITDNAETETAN